MTKETGGAAFPLTRESSFGKNYEGMTLRDWFAGQALVSIIQGDGAQFFNEFKLHAEMAYLQADAMIAERSKP